MRYRRGLLSLFIASLAAAFISSTSAADGLFESASRTGKVLTLTRKDAGDLYEGEWFVKFYAPWCRHCQQLAPEFERAATEWSRDYSSTRPIAFAEVDGTKDIALTARFPIEGYPTMYLVRQGGSDIRKYEGARSAQAIIHFLKTRHESVKPLSIFASPFGPWGQFKGYVCGAGVYWYGWFITIRDALVERGSSPTVAAVVAGGVLLCVAIAAIFSLLWLFFDNGDSGAGWDRAPAPRRPHQD